MKFFMNEKKQKGITLVALVITIIVLLILAGVTIATLTGDNGILTNATQAKFKNQMAELNEELQLFIAEKTTENPNEFLPETLNAGLTVLEYNTKTDEGGDMYQIFSHLPDQYVSKVEVIKGELIVSTTNRQEIKWLQELGMTPNPYRIEDGVLKSSDDNLLLMDSTGTLVIPSQVTKIDNGAFTNTEGLKTIVLPDSLIEIGDYAFSGNSTLEKVVFGSNLQKIGDFAFQRCTALKEVILPDTVTTIGSTCFEQCIALEKVVLSNQLTVLPYRLFSGCTKLKNIVIPNQVQKIQTYCFEFSGIEVLKLSANVSQLDNQAFYSMNQLRTIEIDPQNQYYTFEDGFLLSKEGTTLFMALNSLTQIKIPDTVTTIQTGAFGGCNLVTSIYIPSKVVKLGGDLFIGNSLKTIEVSPENLNYESDAGSLYIKGKKELLFFAKGVGTAVIPEGVERIWSNSFMNCQYTSVELPQSLLILNGFSLTGLTEVEKVRIPKNVTTLQMASFSNRMKIEVDAENPNYQSVDDTMILSKDGTTLVAVSKAVSEYAIPSTVKKIANSAFYGHPNLTHFTIPNQVQSIGINAFDLCYQLQSIEIPSSVTTIQDAAFSRCSQLSEIRIHQPAGKIAGSPWSCPYGERAVKWDNE